MQRVREATDLVALIGRRVSLKRVGSRHVGLCPFHTEKTPSFSVNGADGFYHCFGCKASGDAITFVRETEHLEFTDAVEQLAAAANITLTYDAPGAQRANQRRKELMDLLETAARFYHERLLSGPDAGVARAYLRRRGYDRDTVVKWRLGYAPPLWDALCQHLGAPPAQLAAAGLAYADSRRGSRASRGTSSSAGDEAGEADPTAKSDQTGEAIGAGEADQDDVGEAGRASDFFRDRIMFPICDASGRVVSFAGRLLPRTDAPLPKGPKYKNTAGTVVYDKSKVLYGLHMAKQAARTADRIVVCEGYTDVIGCDLAGISEAVATCGTALTQQHAELLSRSAQRIVLAFDADAAGQTATERVHQWERTYSLDVFVAALPPGSDPGDLAATNPPALRRALEEAQPLHAFRAERILDRAELDSPAGRDRAAEEVAGVFAVYPTDVLEDADLAPIAQRIPMETDDLRKRVIAAHLRLSERPAISSSEPYDTPPPPEPGESYFDAFDNGPPADMDSEDTPVVRSARLGRGTQSRRESSPEQRANDDLDLLAAAVAPQGDTAKLMVAEMFATSAARAAFDRLAADTGVGDTAPFASGTEPEKATPEQGTDPAADMLARARERSSSWSVPHAQDRATTAMRHHVNDLIRSISTGGEIPGVPADWAMSETEQLGHRQEWLRWLQSCKAQLSDPKVRVHVANDLAKRLRGSSDTEPPNVMQPGDEPRAPTGTAG